MAQDGLGLLAMLVLAFTIFCGVCVLISDIIRHRFLFHNGDIIYATEFLLTFFASLFVPSAIVGIGAPLFMKLPSRRVRGWLVLPYLLYFSVSSPGSVLNYSGVSEVIKLIQ